MKMGSHGTLPEAAESAQPAQPRAGEEKSCPYAHGKPSVHIEFYIPSRVTFTPLGFNTVHVFDAFSMHQLAAAAELCGFLNQRWSGKPSGQTPHEEQPSLGTITPVITVIMTAVQYYNYKPDDTGGAGRARFGFQWKNQQQTKRLNSGRVESSSAREEKKYSNEGIKTEKSLKEEDSKRFKLRWAIQGRRSCSLQLYLLVKTKPFVTVIAALLGILIFLAVLVVVVIMVHPGRSRMQAGNVLENNLYSFLRSSGLTNLLYRVENAKNASSGRDVWSLSTSAIRFLRSEGLKDDLDVVDCSHKVNVNALERGTQRFYFSINRFKGEGCEHKFFRHEIAQKAVSSDPRFTYTILRNVIKGLYDSFEGSEDSCQSKAMRHPASSVDSLQAKNLLSWVHCIETTASSFFDCQAETVCPTPDVNSTLSLLANQCLEPVPHQNQHHHHHLELHLRLREAAPPQCPTASQHSQPRKHHHQNHNFYHQEKPCPCYCRRTRIENPPPQHHYRYHYGREVELKKIIYGRFSFNHGLDVTLPELPSPPFPSTSTSLLPTTPNSTSPSPGGPGSEEGEAEGLAVLSLLLPPPSLMLGLAAEVS
ncbi:Receptor tyrosine-protein kinase erbB-2 [Frankliniella fusca]|uniref:Receptor tyrosine-protein kinase erbB-2 n=1 Tax=Frankliniella fusca TaxID=407009 RepID=A0AAE1LEK9_9NEOP|nr:Receptor tyrosine-protein kinase erbB-2 [Frankliniella fusca]